MSIRAIGYLVVTPYTEAVKYFPPTLKPRSHLSVEEVGFVFVFWVFFLISITQLWHFLPPLPVHLFPTECCCLKWDAWGFCRCWGTRWNKNASHLAPKLQARWTGANISWHSTSWNGHQLRRLSSFKTAGSLFTPRSAHCSTNQPRHHWWSFPDGIISLRFHTCRFIAELVFNPSLCF